MVRRFCFTSCLVQQSGLVMFGTTMGWAAVPGCGVRAAVGCVAMRCIAMRCCGMGVRR
jgi:hypothetical protein